MLGRIISLIISLVVCCSVKAADNEQLRFRHYTISEGLTSNTVRAVMQDHQGFIWFGTDDGLCRFDGIMIRRYAPQNHLRGAAFTCIMENDNQVVLGSYDGLYFFDRTTEKFELLTAATSKGVKIKSCVTSVVKDADGCIWISTMEQGVFRYVPETKVLLQFATGSVAHVANLIVDKNNQVWAATGYGAAGLWVFDKARNIFRPYFTSNNRSQQQASYGFALYEDNEGTLWMGSWNGGIVKVKSLVHEEDLPQVMPGSDINHIHSVTGYAPHQLLVCSDEGLIIYDTEQRAIVQRVDDRTGLFSTANRFVYTAIRDHEGGIWTGSFYGGVTYVSTGTKNFASYQSTEDGNGINGSIINRFCEDEKGQIWIASDDGGLNCFNPTTGSFRHYTQSNSGLSYDNVHALCIDGSNLWIGTYTGGVNVLNTSTGSWKHYESNTSLNSCYSIYRDSRGHMWAGTMDAIEMLDAATDQFKVVKQTDMLVIDIDEDANGNMWFSTQGGGIYVYNVKTRKWTQYTYKNTDGGLPDDQVSCLRIAADGQIWVGTQKGLCRYDARLRKFVAVQLDANAYSSKLKRQSATGDEPNPTNSINGIIDDERGLWLTTDNGIIRYVDGKCVNLFTSSDGLVANQFMANAVLKASDGRIYVGTTNGFSAFYPYQIRTNDTAPQVFITGIEIFNKSVAFTPDMVEVEDGKTTINLSYKDAEFSILFAALSYVNPEKNQYAYRLDGFDKDWQYVGAQSRATYTNLSSGTYTFRVKATNNDGLWSSQECVVEVVIHPPFWWSLPAKLIYLVLMALAVFYLLKYYKHRYDRQHQHEMEQLKADKEEEMRNAKLQFFTVIAHEIRTPVSLIIAPLEKIMAQISSPRSAQMDACQSKNTQHPSPEIASIASDLHMIDRNAHRLLELVNQLLDFRKVEQQKLVMHFQVQNLRSLISEVAERFRPSISQHARFTVELPDEHFTAILDPEAIIKVVSNLLTNAGKYTRDEVRLSCQVSPDDEHFLLIVSDNGVGIRQKDRERIFTPFYQAAGNKPGTGIGLSIVKNIVDLHHGKIQLQSVEGQGSTFTIVLPVKQHIDDTDPNLFSGRVADDTASVMSVDDDEKENIRSGMPKAAGSVKKKNEEGPGAVLLVDDNEDMLSFLMDNFKKKYILLTAHDGLEALDILKTNTVQLIVSDWMMPRMDGAEFCRCVRRNPQTSHIPFVLLTAKTDDQAKTEGMKCGADVYIEKPFSMSYLDACLKNLLDMREMLRKKFAHEPLAPISTIASNETDNAFLQQLTKIIEANFSNTDLSVDYIADQMSVSRSGLYSKVKQMSGSTPNELILTMRLKRAAKLLKSRKYRVSEICYMVGFTSPSYFSRCFIKQFGIRPADFANGADTAREN